MTAAEALRAAVLRQVAPLRVFGTPPSRAALPYGVVGEPVLEAADAAGVTGRVGTIVVGCEDDGADPARLRLLLAGIEAVMAALPADLGSGASAGGGGWRLATLRLTRSRIAAGRGTRWTGMSQFAVRLYRMDG